MDFIRAIFEVAMLGPSQPGWPVAAFLATGIVVACVGYVAGAARWLWDRLH